MAFIPDDIFPRLIELTPAELNLYLYHCRCRNKKVGKSYGVLDECAALFGWSKATRFRAQRGLIRKGWIEKNCNGWYLKVGEFQLGKESQKRDSESQKVDFPPASESQKRDQKSQKRDQKSQNLDSHIRNTSNNQQLPIREKPETSSDVTLLFQFWISVFHKGAGTLLTPERKRKIEARLKDGYTVDQIKSAITGCSKSAFHNGQNETGHKHNDIELICRNGVKLEAFEAMNSKPSQSTLSEEEIMTRADVRRSQDAFYGRLAV